MAKQAKAVLPSEHVPVILPIPDPDWAVEIKKFYPGEIDRDLVPGRAPAFVSVKNESRLFLREEIRGHCI